VTGVSVPHSKELFKEVMQAYSSSHAGPFGAHRYDVPSQHRGRALLALRSEVDEARQRTEELRASARPTTDGHDDRVLWARAAVAFADGIRRRMPCLASLFSCSMGDGSTERRLLATALRGCGVRIVEWKPTNDVVDGALVFPSAFATRGAHGPACLLDFGRRWK
jgi:hypothetical protein